jgi:hypothetical protein
VGVDIAVCFAERGLSADSFLRARALSNAGADAVYLVLGPARPESGGKPIFSLWASQGVDLPGLCVELSERISSMASRATWSSGMVPRPRASLHPTATACYCRAAASSRCLESPCSWQRETGTDSPSCCLMRRSHATCCVRPRKAERLLRSHPTLQLASLRPTSTQNRSCQWKWLRPSTAPCRKGPFSFLREDRLWQGREIPRGAGVLLPPASWPPLEDRKVRDQPQARRQLEVRGRPQLLTS